MGRPPECAFFDGPVMSVPRGYWGVGHPGALGTLGCGLAVVRWHSDVVEWR